MTLVPWYNRVSPLRFLRCWWYARRLPVSLSMTDVGTVRLCLRCGVKL